VSARKNVTAYFKEDLDGLLKNESLSSVAAEF